MTQRKQCTHTSGRNLLLALKSSLLLCLAQGLVSSSVLHKVLTRVQARACACATREDSVLSYSSALNKGLDRL